MNARSRSGSPFLESAALVLVTCTAGCAHLPDATINYQLVTSEVKFKVVRTVACDAGKDLVVANAVTPVVVHSADRSGTGTKKLDSRTSKACFQIAMSNSTSMMTVA